MSTPATTVCILGMHRSGTSFLAGSLQQAGLQLGKYHSWNRFNQKGNRQNQEIVDFHDRLLEANKASWCNPPKKLYFSDVDVACARSLAAKYGATGDWGFKDPRTILALDLWSNAVPNLKHTAIFRHPLSVSASLKRMTGGHLELKQSLELWEHYNTLIYKTWKKNEFPLLCFDSSEGELMDQLDKTCTQLGLKHCRGRNQFFSSQLLHYSSVSWKGVPKHLKRLYSQLVEAHKQSMKTMSSRTERYKQ